MPAKDVVNDEPRGEGLGILRVMACGVAALLWLLGASCASIPPVQPLQRFEFEHPEMGMSFRITLYAPDQMTASNAAARAFGRMEDLNGIMSDYDPDSELSRLSLSSGQGREVAVGDDLWFVLCRAQELARRSEGAFDVTVGPYVQLWRRARRQLKLPEPVLLAQARAAVGWQHVRLNPARHAVELEKPGMRLDLGGIAKGYAVAESIKVLRQAGCPRALVEGGGDMALGDAPPGRDGWRVQLETLDATNAPPRRFLALHNVCISTSSDLYQRLEIDGKRYSHIVDPRTGIGLTDHSVVNVIAPEGIDSDSLTKVMAVLGPKRGLPLVEATRGAVARIVRNPAEGVIEVTESRGFKRYEAKP